MGNAVISPQPQVPGIMGEQSASTRARGLLRGQDGAPGQRGPRPSAGTVNGLRPTGGADHSPQAGKETGMEGFSRRDFLKTTAAVGVGAAAGLGFPAILKAQGGGSVKVGVLHSLSGTMAI